MSEEFHARELPATIPLEPSEATPADEPRIQLGAHLVKVRWALSWARQSCSLCDGKGLVKNLRPSPDDVRVVKTPEGIYTLCTCAKVRAVRRLAEHLKAEAAQPIDVPAPGPDPKEQQRIEEKLAGLRRRIVADDLEIARRRQRFEERVQGDRLALAEATKAEHDTSSAVGMAAERADDLRNEIAELERTLALKREALRVAEETASEARAARAKAVAEREARERAIARAEVEWAKNNGGREREVAKLRRRLALATARHGVTGNGAEAQP